MTKINTTNSAIDALTKQQTLRVDADGSNLHTVTGTEKLGLAFQKYVLRKTPDQLGTSQAKIAGALVGLYKNENPGATTSQLSKLLDKFGFSAFASLLQKQAELSSRQATIESGPAFEEPQLDDDGDLYGTFDRSNPGRAGVAKAAEPQTHVAADEIDSMVQSLNLKPDEEPKAPVAAPRTKVPTAAPKTQTTPQSPTTQASAKPSSNALPEYLASPEEIDQALKATQSRALPEHLASADEISQALKTIEQKSTQKPAADRLASAASHGREVAAKKTTSAAPAPATSAPGDIKAQIQDIEMRLNEAQKGRHVNLDGTKTRPFKEGEKEKDVAELNAKLAALKSAGQPSKKADAGAAKLMQDLKSGAVGDSNFLNAMLPLMRDRLGSKTASIFGNHPDYYHHLESKVKARYSNIGVPKDTAVSLANGDAIHANYIPIGGYGDPAIATQAPMSTTIKDFVQMIQEQNVTTIIDLTNTRDREKNNIPDYGRQSEHGFASTDQTSAQLKGAGIEKRELKTAGEHTVSYLNFTSWPDHGVVELGKLKGLVSAIDQEHGNKSGGFAIHCNAGVGRTGTVYAALELNRLANNGELTADNFAEKVIDVVAEGRKARGFAFVQTPGQLNLLFDFAKTLV